AVAAAKKEEQAKKEALEEKAKAENAEKIAVAAAKKEELAKKDALVQKANAEAAKKLAQAARENADLSRADEVKERRKAEEQSYWAQVGLINSKIRANQFADASELLMAQEDSGLRRLRHWEWARQNYLSGTKTADLSPLAARMRNLPKEIQTLVVAPSETWLAYGNRDEIKVVDVVSGAERATLDYPPKGKITALAVSPDERYLAAGGENLDGEVLIWEKSPDANQPWRALAPIKHPGGASRYAPQKRAVGGIVFVPGKNLSLITFVSNRAELYHWTAEAAAVASAPVDSAKSPWLDKLRQLRGHFDRVQSARLAPSGLKPGQDALLSTSDDGSIRLWDLETDTEVLRFVGHNKGSVFDATISPNGEWIASAGYDKRVLLWNLEAARKTAKDKAREAAKEAKKSGQAAPQISTTVRFDPNQFPAHFCELIGHLESVRRVMFMPVSKPAAAAADESQSAKDSLLLVSTSDDNTAIVWHADRAINQTEEQAKPGSAGEAPRATHQPLATRQLVRNVLRGHGSPLQQAFVGRDGMTVIAGTTGLGWHGWNIKTYEEVRQFGELDKYVVVAAKVLPDGKRLVTALQNGETMLWDLESGQSLARFEEGHSFLTNTAQFLPSGLEAITSAGDGTTCCWDLIRGVQKYRLQGTGSKGIMAISADGTRLLTGSDRKTALLWDATQGTLLKELEPYEELIKRFRERNPGATDSSYRSQLPDITALAISPDNNLFLTGDTEGFVKLWNGNGELIKTLAGAHSEAISLVDFLPQVDWVKERHWLAISAGSDGRVTVWNDQGVKDQAASFVTGSTIVSAALSRDARRLVWASNDQQEAPANAAAAGGTSATKSRTESKKTSVPLVSTVIVRDLQARENTVWAKDLPVIVNHVRFFDENDQAVMVTSSEQSKSGTNTRQVLTCYRDGKPLEGGVLREAGPWSAASSPNARQLLAVSGKEARLYDILQQNAGATGFKFKTSLRRHSKVNAVDVTPDGKLLVTAGSEGQVKLWDLETHRALHQFKDGHAPETEIFSASFSPDGKFLLTAGADGKLCLWNVAERKLVHLAGAPVPPGSKTDSNSVAIRCTHFSPDGRQLVVSSDQSNARVYNVRWQANSAELLNPREIKFVDEDDDSNSRHTIGLSAAVFTPDGQHLLTVNNPTIDRGGTAQAWSLTARGDFVPRGAKLADNITSLALSADGLRALLGDESGRVSLRDMRALSLPPEADEKFNEVLELARYELAAKKSGAGSNNRHERRVSFVSFSPNGRDVITASQDGTALLWLGEVLPPTVELSPEETQMSKESQIGRIDSKLRVSYPTKNLLEETQIVVHIEPAEDTDANRVQPRALNGNAGDGNGNGDAAPAVAKKSEITIDYTPEKSRAIDEPAPRWQINEQGQVLLNSAVGAADSQPVGSVKRENLGAQGERFTITLHKDAPSYLMQEILRSLKVKWDAADPNDSRAYQAQIDIVPSSLANQRSIRSPAALEKRRINYKVQQAQ
ncbi:MAG: eIF2A-related protein, partial [Planctomycetota bacterium]